MKNIITLVFILALFSYDALTKKHTSFIPNSFSPNGDRINEIFKPIISLANLNNYNLLIFNRWEHPIFESNDYNIGWDGSITGSSQKAAIGSYLYQVSFTDGSGVYKVQRGVVTLMR